MDDATPAFEPDARRHTIESRAQCSTVSRQAFAAGGTDVTVLTPSQTLVATRIARMATIAGASSATTKLDPNRAGVVMGIKLKQFSHGARTQMTR
jgi:hypothetical protein